jgi:2-dehydro-3-deoxyphosphogluconate aldolase/(4S)-4-hydroxy-2-oxoglutarate aldolase
MMNTLYSHPLVPVYYHPDIDEAKKIVAACYEGGVRVFEFTNRGPQALPVFTSLVAYVKANCPGMHIGIGTIADAESAQAFIAAGAEFVVQPFTTPEVGEVCAAAGIPWMPGTMTLTEMQTAIRLGAHCVKLFPGNVLGSAFVKALRGPMPDVKIMVTGGVEPTEASLKEWFSAGANVVGLGSQLFKNSPDQIAVLLKDCFRYIEKY